MGYVFNWYLWSITGLSYLEGGFGSRILASTNRACHLTTKWKTKPPFKRRVYKRIRGEKVLCDLVYSFRKPNITEQRETGDTFLHTFDQLPWPVCETHWFYMIGNVQGFHYISKSPFFHHHHPTGNWGPPETVYCYPDPAPAEKAVDGWVYRFCNPCTWASLHDGYGTRSTDGDTYMGMQIYAANVEDKWYDLARSIILFDTTAIPVAANIVSAELRVRCSGKGFTSSGWGPDFTIVGSYPFKDTELIPLDYGHLYNTPLADIKTWNDFRVGYYTTFTLNSVGLSSLNPGGITKLGFRENKYDNSGLHPTWQSGKGFYININSRDQGLNWGPRLAVTYQPPL